MKKLLFLFCLFFCYRAAAAEIDTKLLNEMYTTVCDSYIEPVEPAQITVNGLQAVTALDPDIIISKGSDKFYLYYKKQLKKVIPQPADVRDIKSWAETASVILQNAAQLSETVAQKDFELPDLMMKEITGKLDPYSAYYSEYDYEEKEEGNGIYTLFNDRKIDDILYLRVRIFNKQTAKQIENALKRHAPFSGIVLDLRGNSGGILNEALKTADFFTDSAIITYTAGRNEENKHYYTSKEGTPYAEPLVILVDGETASAAEVLAAGMQEQSRAKIVGTRTFGKGTIQNVTQMSNGGKLVLTTEQFFTPSGKAIHRNGITPDICVSPDTDGSCKKESRVWEDSDMEKAIALLKNEL